MSKELYLNNAVSYVDTTAITSTSATTFTIHDATNFPTTGGYRVLVDSEIMYVSGVSGTTVTVARGQEGTTAATHAVGATVTAVLTDLGLRKLCRQSHGGTLVTERRELNFVDGGGVTWALTDDSANDRVAVSATATGSGSSSGWEAAFSKPTVSQTTWWNQQDATATDTANGIALVAPKSSTLGTRALLFPITGTSPWTAILRLSLLGFNSTIGPFIRNSSTGAAERYPFYYYSGAFRFGFDQSNNSPTTWTYQDYLDNTFLRMHTWVKFSDNGTLRNVYLSNDGITWVLAYSRSSNAYTGVPDQIGVGIDVTTDRNSALTIMSFAASNP